MFWIALQLASKTFMNTKGKLRVLESLVLMLVIIGAPNLFGAERGKAGNPPLTATSPAPQLLVTVDPRVELLSIIFCLAGNPEYGKGRVASYSKDVEAQFAPFREHKVIRLASELRRPRGVSYDACMSLAVHLSDADELKLCVPLEPWPEALDRRWSDDIITQ